MRKNKPIPARDLLYFEPLVKKKNSRLKFFRDLPLSSKVMVTLEAIAIISWFVFVSTNGFVYRYPPRKNYPAKYIGPVAPGDTINNRDPFMTPAQERIAIINEIAKLFVGVGIGTMFIHAMLWNFKGQQLAYPSIFKHYD